jgi:predicted nucleic acid-binding Zn ribbon protein
MNWDDIKAQINSAVKQESVKVLDEAIARLQRLRDEYLGGKLVGALVTPLPLPARKSDEITRSSATDQALPPMPDRTCAVCGKPFTPLAPLSKTCSGECRKERNRSYKREYKQEVPPRQPRRCVVCDMEFVPDDRLGKSITCSPECSKERVRQYDAAKYARRRSVTPQRNDPDETKPTYNHRARTFEPRNCITCGIEFMPTHHLQKTCLRHRSGTSKTAKNINTDFGLTPEEKEWKHYAESASARLAQHPNAVKLPRAA